jgi:hypothetical protein
MYIINRTGMVGTQVVCLWFYHCKFEKRREEEREENEEKEKKKEENICRIQ